MLNHKPRISWGILCCILTVGNLNAWEQPSHGSEAQESTNKLTRFEYTHIMMGTELKLILYAKSQSLAAFAISAVLEDLEDRSLPINNYSQNSEVSKLAHAEAGVPQTLSRELSEVLLEAKRWHELSAGAFDVTAGATLDLWSTARKRKKLPTTEEIAIAIQKSGWDGVLLTTTESSPVTLTMRSPGTKINVSGIATGYLIDHAMATLKSQGIDTALIDIGGDIIVSEPPPDTEGWTIDIAGLRPNDPVQSRVILRHQAVTTSGDLNQFTEIDGVRYSHLIDPSTGQPVSRRVSATVIARRAIDADAGATAIAVLGIERAKQFVEQLPVDSVFVVEQEHSDTKSEKLPIHYQWSRLPEIQKSSEIKTR